MIAFHDAHIYDFPSAFRRRYRVLRRLLRPRLARRALRCLTVSPYSADRLSAHFSVPRTHFEIVPNAAVHVLDLRPDPSFLDRLGLNARGYLLTVGNQSPLKNIARLIAAHARLPHAPPLVVAGGSSARLARARLPATDRVILTGAISDAELRALYEGARALVHPSLSEGFGIPPLEAATLGVPILAARRGAMPWVLREAPIWFEAEDECDMSAAIERFLELKNSDALSMSQAAEARASAFSWARSAECLHQILKDADKDACHRPAGAKRQVAVSAINPRSVQNRGPSA